MPAVHYRRNEEAIDGALLIEAAAFESWNANKGSLNEGDPVTDVPIDSHLAETLVNSKLRWCSDDL
jgi:hypothetical protein